MREQYDEAELDREGAGLIIVGVVGMVLSCFHWAQQCRQEHWYGIQNFRPFGGIFLCHEGAMGHFYTIRVLAQSLTVLDKFIKFNSRSYSLVGISKTVW
jgi:hypothetical protein